MSRKTAFTLIELLVVIAIIAILAALIFPVFMRAKENAYRAGDMSNMNAIRDALTLYRADQGGYPPQLLGYVTRYTAGPQMGQVIPASELHQALYPKRVDSINTLKPAYDRVGETSFHVPVWPNKDSRQVGLAPIGDWNGDGVVDGNDDVAGTRQANAGGSTGLECYDISGYDMADVKNPDGTDRFELHYTLKWSNFAFGGGSAVDDPRQLIYANPPDSTVVTWDSWFREYDSSGLPTHAKKDIVLFLGGTARPYDSADVNDRSWRVMP